MFQVSALKDDKLCDILILRRLFHSFITGQRYSNILMRQHLSQPELSNVHQTEQIKQFQMFFGKSTFIQGPGYAAEENKPDQYCLQAKT